MKLTTLKKAIDCQAKESKNLSKMSWIQKDNYLSNENRIYCLYLLYYFLFLREKIKKEVRESYRNKTKEEIVNLIVIYDEDESLDFEYVFLRKEHLQPLIEEYTQKQIYKIENNTLRLQL